MDEKTQMNNFTKWRCIISRVCLIFHIDIVSVLIRENIIVRMAGVVDSGLFCVCGC